VLEFHDEVAITAPVDAVVISLDDALDAPACWDDPDEDEPPENKLPKKLPIPENGLEFPVAAGAASLGASAAAAVGEVALGAGADATEGAAAVAMTGADAGSACGAPGSAMPALL